MSEWSGTRVQPEDVKTQNLSDEELLERVQAQNLGALEALYDRHAGQALALARRIVSDGDAAEEVVQDAFLALWRRSATYDTAAGRVRPWLLSIVRNRAIDEIRSAKRRRGMASLDEAWMKPSDSDVFRDVARGLERERIIQALAELPPEQRDVIDKAYFEGLTYAEVAERGSIPLGTVKSRARLGLGRLRELLTGGVA
jgi:RNA polymerase sigma-70 factor, ECF subfamily